MTVIKNATVNVTVNLTPPEAQKTLHTIVATLTTLGTRKATVITTATHFDFTVTLHRCRPPLVLHLNGIDSAAGAVISQ